MEAHPLIIRGLETVWRQSPCTRQQVRHYRRHECSRDRRSRSAPERIANLADPTAGLATGEYPDTQVAHLTLQRHQGNESRPEPGMGGE